MCWGCGNATAGHQPSHQDEPGGAVVEGVLAVAEDVRAFLGAGIRAGVVHKSLIVNQVRHLTLSLVCQLGDLGVSGGKGRRGGAVGQALIDTTMEDGGAERVGSLGTVWQEPRKGNSGVIEELNSPMQLNMNGLDVIFHFEIVF